jgi:uncharacterized protein (TIGR03437 family)
VSRRLSAALLCGLLAAAAPSQGYYYFVHYLNGGNAPEKFDLSALPARTVTFFVSEDGPTTYTATDTFNSVLGQIQHAAAVWNGVASSGLRVSFGGIENASTQQNTPGGDVIFEDLPPGVEGYGGPTSTASPVTAADGSRFVPIVRSVIHLNRNLTLAPGPSYSQSFFMTVLHEMGHALGLQHTFTSATMSQATTRATTLTHPLGADDVAGVSALYPNASLAQFGSITGQVSAGGQPVHLASVVAIQAGADAVSAVTNPDGTFRIDGVPPGQYYVYVHTMPPDADISGPWNTDGSVASATGPLSTVFYSTSSAVQVQPGMVTAGINIATTTRGDVPLYDGQIYGFFDNDAIEITPADVNVLASGPTTVAASIVTAANGLAPGLGVQAMGGSVAITNVQPYTGNGFTYYALNLSFNPQGQPGPQHLIFEIPGYLYVLPSGINLTQSDPPTVTSVKANGDGTLTLTGTNWTSTTLLYFDSLPATIVSLDPKAGTAVVVPPQGSNNQQATVTAFNTDGQNSQLLQSASPVTFAYGSAATPSISISPSSLPAGAEAAIDITASGFTFTPGATTVGFGTSDIFVQRLFVLSPTHIQADVYVSPNAALSNPDVTAVSGFQIATTPSAFQITPAVAGLAAPYPLLVNGLSGLTGSYAGAIVSLYGLNLAAPNGTPSIMIGGQPATILYASPSQINLQIPTGLTPGPTTLLVNNGLIPGLPVTVNIDTPPADIAAVQNSSGAYIYGANPAHPGDTLIVTLTGFGQPGATVAPSAVQVGVGGVNHQATQINQVGEYTQVTFQLNPNDTVGQSQQLVVYLNGRSSYPALIPVVNPGD